nr:hypothetical protein [Enterococcus cecorum]
MFEHFSEIDLHIVELPVEVQDGKPVYQGFIQEFPYMQRHSQLQARTQ